MFNFTHISQKFYNFYFIYILTSLWIHQVIINLALSLLILSINLKYYVLIIPIVCIYDIINLYYIFIPNFSLHYIYLFLFSFNLLQLLTVNTFNISIKSESIWKFLKDKPISILSYDRMKKLFLIFTNSKLNPIVN